MFAQKWWPLMQCASCKTAPFSATPTLHFISEKLRKSIFLPFFEHSCLFIIYHFDCRVPWYRSTHDSSLFSPWTVHWWWFQPHPDTYSKTGVLTMYVLPTGDFWDNLSQMSGVTQQNGGLHGVVPRFPSIPTTVSTSDHTWLTNSTLASDTLWTGLSKIDRSVQPFRTLPWPPIVRNVI